MKTRDLRTIVPGMVLAVALMISALPALAGHDGTSSTDTASTAVISDTASSSGGGGSLIWWFVGGAVVIAVIGYFFYAKGKKNKGAVQ